VAFEYDRRVSPMTPSAFAVRRDSYPNAEKRNAWISGWIRRLALNAPLVIHNTSFNISLVNADHDQKDTSGRSPRLREAGRVRVRGRIATTMARRRT
jgi:hypothetical protein